MKYLVKAICLKSYYDEDDYERYKSGEINLNQVEKFEEGKIYMVVEGYYDSSYFKKLFWFFCNCVIAL